MGLLQSDRVPDLKTIWLFKNGLASSGARPDLFAFFGVHLEVLGYRAQKGQLIDPSIQEVRKPRSLAPEDYETEAAKAQHDTDATSKKDIKCPNKGGHPPLHIFRLPLQVKTQNHGLIEVPCILTAGNRNDITQGPALVEGVRDANILADKGYDCDAFVLQIQAQQCIPVIPPRKKRKLPRAYDKHLYRERHLVECFFGKKKNFRRVFSRFDKKASVFAGFLAFVSAILWLR